MKLLFLTTFDYPSRYAHPIHGLHMARAFARVLKDDFLFVCNTVSDPKLLEGVPTHMPFGKWGRLIKKLRLRSVMLFLWFPYFMLRHKQWRSSSTVFTNDPILFCIARFYKPLFRFTLAFEVHGEYRFPPRRFFTSADRLIFVTKGLRDRFVASLSNPPASIVLPNAADVGAFEAVTSSTAALRKKLSLPENTFFVGYIGRFKPLGFDKGLSFMLRALSSLSQDVFILAVGGLPAEVEEYQAKARELGHELRAIFVSHVPSELVPEYAKVCDALAYVPEDRNFFFETETSPMKLFEYMASRRPIIASDTGAVREILNDASAYLIPPGNIEVFVKAVESMRSRPDVSTLKAKVAFDAVTQNSWLERVRKIADFCKR